MTERQMQESVRVAALRTGWLFYHVYDARRSDPGFPDCVLIRRADDIAWRGKRLIWIELKTEKGKLSDDQQNWIGALRQAGETAIVVRPDDLEWLYGYLAGARPARVA